MMKQSLWFFNAETLVVSDADCAEQQCRDAAELCRALIGGINTVEYRGNAAGTMVVRRIVAGVYNNIIYIAVRIDRLSDEELLVIKEDGIQLAPGDLNLFDQCPDRWTEIDSLRYHDILSKFVKKGHYECN